MYEDLGCLINRNFCLMNISSMVHVHFSLLVMGVYGGSLQAKVLKYVF